MEIELLLGASGGSDAAFYPLVFFHVVSALAGFGSIGFAGVYASRAAQMAVPEARRPGEPAGGAGETRSGDLAAAPLDLPPAESPPLSRLATEATQAATPAHAASGAAPQQLGPGPAGQPAQASGATGPAPATTSPGTAGPLTPSSAEPSSAGEPPPLDPEIEELARYFSRPARFWKAVLAVPVFGALALWAEPGGGGLDQVWDIAAMFVWAGAALLAAGLVVPSLRQVRSALQGLGSARPPDAASRAKLARYGRLASRGAAACDVLFFVALALMIWRP